MSTLRFNAIDTFLNRSAYDYDYSELSEEPISDFFGCNVFDDNAMKQYLPTGVYEKVKKVIADGTKLDREFAGEVAEGMKNWAMDKGASHFAHWFQPLTGRTAEKHDSFFNKLPSGDIVNEFSADHLAQQEPDGSSFPGGGLRSTFEARGYTAWDPSSPAFIMEFNGGKTLCIPTIFVTYGGEALDYKLPLLRSCEFLEANALKVCSLFDKDVSRVYTTLGWEQEYFLVDEALFFSRPDLMLCGRTLVGKHATKGQQLDDHYFAAIPERVYRYMRDMETEAHKLGIPLRTRHNEVGPGQYELAPMFEEVNVAIDHNTLLMDVMERVAKNHKFRVLFHEKPFAGVNGSGKHNNWSMSTDTGKNLLKPGNNAGKNLEFLSFFVNTIMAVWKYNDLLRASVASASNDHRLGANEAPPAIISVFNGHYLSQVLDALENNDGNSPTGYEEALNLLSKVPDLEKDNTDRNRTSPFAFTGNKFEFRMVGSSMNCAAPMTVLNMIVGEQLQLFYEEVQSAMKSGTTQDKAVLTILKKYVTESKNVRFEGDGYSDEWKVDAEKRGLANTPSTPDAIQAYLLEKNKAAFLRSGVLTEKELDAHYEVMVENYILKVQIESRTLGEMAINHVLPTGIALQTKIAQNIKSLTDIGIKNSDFQVQMDLVQNLGELISTIRTKVNEMSEARRKVNEYDDSTKIAQGYATDVLPVMEEVRVAVDRLEYLVEDKDWPLAKYRELMFIR